MIPDRQTLNPEFRGLGFRGFLPTVTVRGKSQARCIGRILGSPYSKICRILAAADGAPGGTGL